MKLLRQIAFVLMLAAVFAAGYGYNRWYGKTTMTKVAGGERRILYYDDAMNPASHTDKPGKAPDGLDLVPKYADADTSTSAGKPANLPMGTIQISPQKQQLIGVKYGSPTYGESTKTIRAVGKVTPDERRITHVHTRVEAWIDKVFVDFTGKAVEDNQPLLTLYSPDLLSTQEEFLLALKSRDLMKASTLPVAQDQSNSLIAAARRRLELWDLSEAQISELTESRKPITNTTLYSPTSGYVMARNAFPKQHVTPDTELYTLIDLREVWIMADFFENEAAQIRVGEPVTVSLPFGSGRTIRGRVDFIQPQVDPMTRTLKVRIDAENSDLMLKPDMFIEVNLSVALPQHLTMPSDAVLDSGLKKTVFVDRGNGYLEPRAVETGERIGDRVEILHGLRPNERIAISGTFLIDSESQLKSAASGMAGMPGMPGMPATPETEKTVTPKTATREAPVKPSKESSRKDMSGMEGMAKRP
jgi:RND family efflux transporter MFP subunit